jgi:hypothetical protein
MDFMDDRLRRKLIKRRGWSKPAWTRSSSPES